MIKLSTEDQLFINLVHDTADELVKEAFIGAALQAGWKAMPGLASKGYAAAGRAGAGAMQAGRGMKSNYGTLRTFGASRMGAAQGVAGTAARNALRKMPGVGQLGRMAPGAAGAARL